MPRRAVPGVTAELVPDVSFEQVGHTEITAAVRRAIGGPAEN